MDFDLTKVFVFHFVISMSAVTNAGTGTGKITGYIPYNSGELELLFFRVESHVGSPDCNTTKRFTMRSDSPRFKNTQAVVLAAMLSGTQVTARGLNKCDNISNSEDLNYLCLGSIPC